MKEHPERVEDYLSHILEALRRTQRYTAGKSLSDFLDSVLIQDAVLRNLSILGEASHPGRRSGIRHQAFGDSAGKDLCHAQSNYPCLRTGRFGNCLEFDSKRYSQSDSENSRGIEFMGRLTAEILENLAQLSKKSRWDDLNWMAGDLLRKSI